MQDDPSQASLSPPPESVCHDAVGLPQAVPHGGRRLAARHRYPDAPLPLVDLSTGINPVAYPLPHLSVASFTELPDPDALQALHWEAAAAYGVAHADMVAAAPGAQALIGLLPLLFPARSVAVLEPTYGEYAPCWAAAGADISCVDTIGQLDGAACAVVCNPNNPDGTCHPPAVLLALADDLAASGGLLVVDESFADLESGANSMAAHLPHPAILVLRSFGKAYGLAGLRLGFALAAPERIARLRTALGPWPVSGAAIAIGRQALADRAWRITAMARLRQDAGRLDQMLNSCGMRVLGGTRLFRLAETPDAAAIADRLGRAGILVRSFADRPHWLRFGLPGTPQHWNRLSAALNADPLCGAFMPWGMASA